MTSVIERTTADLRAEVLSALAERPIFGNARIAADEVDGIVTLTGMVDCHAKRLAAEEVARGVRGVRTVVNDIQITRDAVFGWRDVDLIEGAGQILRSHYVLAGKKLVITARDGVVTLGGRVNTLFERVEAERAISPLPSLQGIRNRIDVVPPRVDPDVLQRQAEDAVYRVVGDAASAIDVRVTGRNVALVGSVREWRDKIACRDAVSTIRGVAAVDDLVDVD